MFDFPDLPTTGQQIANGSALYQWDGVKWIGIGGTGGTGGGGGASLSLDAAVTATGTNYATAYALKAYTTNVVAGSAGTGVKLPVWVAGMELGPDGLFVIRARMGADLLVWPDPSTTIKPLTVAGAPITVPDGADSFFSAGVANTWQAS